MAGQWTENTEIKKIAVPVQASEVWQAAELLKHGEVVAFPTETVYGLGALGLDEAAVAKLYEIKNRPREKAFSLHDSVAAQQRLSGLDAKGIAAAVLKEAETQRKCGGHGLRANA